MIKLSLVSTYMWANSIRNFKNSHLKKLGEVWGFPGGVSGKEPPTNAGDIRDAGLIPGWARVPGGGHGNPLEYSCLENPTDRGARWATVHRVAQSWTRLN